MNEHAKFKVTILNGIRVFSTTESNLVAFLNLMFNTKII